jgi:exo-beta-1,3-glucanase (GH17 family)
MKTPFALAALLFASVAVNADDSQFDKDPRLHQSMWGIAYTPPLASNYPTCGDKIEDIVKDVQLMSQLTTRLRLYGADCGQTDLVLNALQRTNVNMQVWLGIFIDGTDATYQRQLQETFDAIKKYGTRNVAGITVGNEYILQANTASPATRPTAEAYVIKQMADTRAKLKAQNFDKAIPVGTADAGSMITLALSEGAEYVMANTHAFFSGINIDGAADWIAQYLINDEPRFVAQASNKPTLLNAEVGWPSNAMAGGDLTLNGSIASLPNLQKFLDTFICAANQNNTNGYFYFEFADGAWKTQYGGAEPFWGLFDKDRNFKALTIPTCLAEAAVTPGASSGGSGGSGSSGSGSGGSTTKPGSAFALQTPGIAALISLISVALGTVML